MQNLNSNFTGTHVTTHCTSRFIAI
ncbi:hypothetical protein CNO14_06785 (plasmid) [Borrelia miyamotoi]|uniref:Uncharacterized protein n=1 Tax=Borrelia miyamotoi TaxID=47466 RepID=A0AAQ3CMS2_9SPIR|nr:hypothetical protein [Borrelia miyamotoi]WAZ71054.1 hypothetical protein O5403_04730 [Borrelia miyamotoi]WCB91035.1 hypothetical protein CNO11_07170 [Borrelia miyamotoi]WCL22164.1 hypothetical protein CNO10_07200 [Borrelia miyamotoi]WDE70392.1 hypothetical protein CNO12_07220 [Borrelia miyamotoi]WDE71667.1 hypothetical protein CNO13_06570 [Borrelia miyamotoi]